MYGPISKVSPEAYWLYATTIKIWKLQSFCPFFQAKKIGFIPLPPDPKNSPVLPWPSFSVFSSYRYFLNHCFTIRKLVAKVLLYLLIQDGKLTEEQFASNLQTTLNSPPQPNLVGFLKVRLVSLVIGLQ